MTEVDNLKSTLKYFVNFKKETKSNEPMVQQKRI